MGSYSFTGAAHWSLLTLNSLFNNSENCSRTNTHTHTLALALSRSLLCLSISLRCVCAHKTHTFLFSQLEKYSVWLLMLKPLAMNQSLSDLTFSYCSISLIAVLWEFSSRHSCALRHTCRQYSVCVLVCWRYEKQHPWGWPNVPRWVCSHSIRITNRAGRLSMDD